MTFEQPPDDNFESWHDSLLEQVYNTCGQEVSFRGAHSLKLGLDVFDRMSAHRGDDADRLEAALAGETGLGSYINKGLPGEITYMVLSVIMLIISILAAAALAQSVRGCVANWFCGSCRTRTRIRMKAVKPHNRSFLLVANFLGACCAIAAFIFSIFLSVQGITGTKRAVCGVWLGLFGHYFGVSEIEWRPETREISWSWSGSHNIMEQLRELDTRLAPGVDNPVYVELLEKYDDLQLDATAQAEMARDIVLQLQYESLSWNETWSEWLALPRQTSKDNIELWRMLATEASIGKSDTYMNEMDDTLAQGWVEIRGLIDKYSGPSARLMRKASDAVKDAFLTIADVDAVVAALTKKWDNSAGSVRALLLTVLSFDLIVLALGFIVASVLFGLSIDLAQRLTRDQFPNKTTRRGWAVCFAFFCVLAGCAMFFSAFSLLLGTVGVDVCNVLRETVFDGGRWDLLGDDILAPREPMNVDVDVVFNTCLRNDGMGDVASSLGLDGRIAELAEDTDAALLDIRGTRDRLLDRDAKTTRAQVLAVAYKDLLELHAKDKVDLSSIGLTNLPTTVYYFNETEFVRFDADDYEKTGRRSVLCVVPRIMEGVMSAAVDCVGGGVQYNIAPHNRAMDVLNEAAEFVYEAATEAGTLAKLKTFPRQFCSQHAIRQNLQCADWADQEDTYMLTSKIYSDSSSLLNSWTSQVESAVPGATTLGNPNYKIGAKIVSLASLLGDINDLTSKEILDLQTLTCSIPEESTTWPDTTSGLSATSGLDVTSGLDNTSRLDITSGLDTTSEHDRSSGLDSTSKSNYSSERDHSSGPIYSSEQVHSSGPIFSSELDHSSGSIELIHSSGSDHSSEPSHLSNSNFSSELVRSFGPGHTSKSPSSSELAHPSQPDHSTESDSSSEPNHLSTSNYSSELVRSFGPAHTSKSPSSSELAHSSELDHSSESDSSSEPNHLSDSNYSSELVRSFEPDPSSEPDYSSGPDTMFNYSMSDLIYDPDVAARRNLHAFVNLAEYQQAPAYSPIWSPEGLTENSVTSAVHGLGKADSVDGSSHINCERTHLKCKDGTQNCRLDEARQVGLASVSKRADDVVQATIDLFAYFDVYVDDQVAPLMEGLVTDANAVTDGSNCQFEGTAFQVGGVDPLCVNAFPAFILYAILLGCASVVNLLFAIHTWKWYHYMEDLALDCQDNEHQYDAQKGPADAEAAMSDFVAIYNASPRYLQPVVTQLSGSGQDALLKQTPETLSGSETVTHRSPAALGQAPFNPIIGDVLSPAAPQPLLQGSELHANADVPPMLLPSNLSFEPSSPSPSAVINHDVSGLDMQVEELGGEFEPQQSTDSMYLISAATRHFD